MPSTSSAKKALRQAERRHEKNLVLKSALRRALHSVSKETLAQTVSLIDKAVRHRLLHANRAARLKRQLATTVGVATSKRPAAGTKPAKARAAKPKNAPKTAT